MHWPQQKILCEVPEDDVEVKKEIVFNTKCTSSGFIDGFADHYSDWRTLQHATAWLVRFSFAMLMDVDNNW